MAVLQGACGIPWRRSASNPCYSLAVALWFHVAHEETPSTHCLWYLVIQRIFPVARIKVPQRNGKPKPRATSMAWPLQREANSLGKTWEDHAARLVSSARSAIAHCFCAFTLLWGELSTLASEIEVKTSRSSPRSFTCPQFFMFDPGLQDWGA